MTTAARGGPQHIPRPPGWEPGDPARWIGAPIDDLSLDDVCRVVASGSVPPRRAPVDTATRWASSVLVPLYEDAGQVHVVLTRRSWQLRSHTGEVSFPGGRREAGDVDLWETATREAMEEIALDPTVAERIGELDHLATVSSNSTIVPYVAALPRRPELVPNDDEVDAILHVPMVELADPGVYRQEIWRWDGMERPIHFFELVGDTVWGATASMLVDLLARISAVR